MRKNFVFLFWRHRKQALSRIRGEGRVWCWCCCAVYSVPGHNIMCPHTNNTTTEYALTRRGWAGSKSSVAGASRVLIRLNTNETGSCHLLPCHWPGGQHSHSFLKYRILRRMSQSSCANWINPIRVSDFWSQVNQSLRTRIIDQTLCWITLNLIMEQQYLRSVSLFLFHSDSAWQS